MLMSTYLCSAQFRNLLNLKIVLHILRVRKLHTNLAIAHSILRLHNTFVFPSYIKVRDVLNKLLQLCRHLQCRACILKPPQQGLLGSSPTRRNSLPLGLGTGAERSQTCGVPPFKASPSLKVFNSLLLVSSDAFTPVAYYFHKLHSRNLEIVQTYCAISRLSAQSRDWHAISGF